MGLKNLFSVSRLEEIYGKFSPHSKTFRRNINRVKDMKIEMKSRELRSSTKFNKGIFRKCEVKPEVLNRLAKPFALRK